MFPTLRERAANNCSGRMAAVSAYRVQEPAHDGLRQEAGACCLAAHVSNTRLSPSLTRVPGRTTGGETTGLAPTSWDSAMTSQMRRLTSRA
jgi:hypothetical protein